MLILHLSVTEGRIRSSQNYIAQKTKAFSFQGITFIKKKKLNRNLSKMSPTFQYTSNRLKPI